MEYPLCKRVSVAIYGSGCLNKGRLTLERASVRSLDGYIEVSQIVIVRSSCNSWSWVCHKTFGFLSKNDGIERLF